MAATIALLAEVGYSATTVTAVARRAGVPVPAVYRRWPNRVALIESAIAPRQDVAIAEPTGDLLADVQAFVDLYSRMFETPAARAGFIGLLSDYQGDPVGNRSVSLRLGRHAREAFGKLLQAQRPVTMEKDVDADALLDILIGAVIYRQLVMPYTGREASVDRTAQTLYQAITRDSPTGHQPPPLNQPG